jgi:hypothetical protein
MRKDGSSGCVPDEEIVDEKSLSDTGNESLVISSSL